jgi:hypothetical protein
MLNKGSLNRLGGQGLPAGKFSLGGTGVPRQLLIGVILILALFAFEMFNFDTTRFALESLLGDVRFAGLAWATILAVAFCAIDFAGLARLFTPERGMDEPKEIWYLTGAWLLGATMNAVMTWWAVSLVLLEGPLGNEVMSRDQLLNIVPIFVAALVWLTRILFIGAVTLAGERLLHSRATTSLSKTEAPAPRQPGQTAQQSAAPVRQYSKSSQLKAPVELASAPTPTSAAPTRVNRRPPRPRVNGSNSSNKTQPNYAAKRR